MIVIVAGSRDITDPEIIRDEMNRFHREVAPVTKVVAGGARGVDRLAASIARKAGIPVDEHPADWDRYGRSAGYRRNEEMAQAAEGLLAIWDGESKGTKHMIDIARKAGLTVRVVIRRN